MNRWLISSLRRGGSERSRKLCETADKSLKLLTVGDF